MFRRSIWYRGRRPRLEEGHFKGGLTRDSQEYDPFEEMNLPNAFAKVKDERSAVRFVERYGLLGYSNLKFGWPSFSTPWHELDQDDPLVWVLWQATTVRFALDIVRLLQFERCDSLRDCLSNQQIPLTESEVAETQKRTNLVWPVAVRGYRYRCAVGLEPMKDAYLLVDEFRGIAPQKKDPCSVEDEPDVIFLGRLGDDPWGFYSGHARDVLARLVSDNTGHVRRVLHDKELPGGRTGLAIGHEFYALIEVIWHHVGNMAVLSDEGMGKRIGICRECGTPFVASRKPRQGHPEFCPQETGSGRGSRCGLRYRARERRRGEREVK